MTIYTKLEEKKSGNQTVTAWKKQEKYSNCFEYEIAVSVDDLVLHVIPTARTTWKKKFNETN